MIVRYFLPLLMLTFCSGCATRWVTVEPPKRLANESNIRVTKASVYQERFLKDVLALKRDIDSERTCCDGTDAPASCEQFLAKATTTWNSAIRLSVVMNSTLPTTDKARALNAERWTMDANDTCARRAGDESPRK
jgi:hypothetical protein